MPRLITEWWTSHAGRPLELPRRRWSAHPSGRPWGDEPPSCRSVGYRVRAVPIPGVPGGSACPLCGLDLSVPASAHNHPAPALREDPHRG